MKKFIMLIVLVVCVAFIFIGCSEEAPVKSSADSAIQYQQEKALKEMVRQTGLPAIQNFQEKKMLKMLYELRDQENLICHVYLMNQITGKVGQYLGKCIGYGLPASTQYSNPEKIVVNKFNTYNGSGGIYGTLPQAEPNGLFMPEGLSATWLMMIDPDTGDPRPVYVEPLIIVSPFKLRIDTDPISIAIES